MKLRMSDSEPQSPVERIDRLIAMLESGCPAAYLMDELRKLRAEVSQQAH